MLLRNRLRLNTFFDQGSVAGHLSLDVRSDKTGQESELEISLREAYVDIYFNHADLRIGKQQVVWGKADGLFINDIVCPLDMRMFLLQDFDNIRMGLSMMKVNVYLYNWTLEGVWIPEFEPWKFAEPGSDWEFRLGPPDTLLNVSSQPICTMVPDIFLFHVDNPVLPGGSLRNSEYGLRLSSFLFGTDISLLLLDGFSDYPIAQLDSAVFTIGLFEGMEHIDYYLTPRYYRSTMYGLNFSRSVFSMVIRGEMGYFTDRRFTDFEALPLYSVSDFFQGMIGLDMTGPFNSGISFQGIRQQILDYRDSMVDDEVRHMTSILFRGSFWRETAYLIVLGIIDLSKIEWKDYDFKKSAGLARIAFDYSWTDGLIFSIGTDILWGEKDSIFGQFETNDNLFFKVKYYF